MSSGPDAVYEEKAIQSSSSAANRVASGYDIRREDVGIASSLRSTPRDDRDMPKEVSKQGVVSPSELTQRTDISHTVQK